MNARIKRGSSIVELLVVMAIIALLMAALVPSLRRSMILARNTVCMHNIHMVGQGLAQYRYDNDGWLPTDGPISTSDSDAPGEVWFLKLHPTYLNDPVVLTCPEDPFRHRMVQVGPLQDIRNLPNIADYASYGLNSFLLNAGNGSLADLDRRRPTRPLDIILAADMGPDEILVGDPQDVSINNGPERNASLLTWDDGYNPFMPLQDTHPWVTMRHGGSINMLTIDGGVRAARTKNTLQGPIQSFYPACAAGGCTLCNELHLFHYSFAEDRLFWWTGPSPVE